MGPVGGLAVGQPVLHGFTFEGLIESAAGFYRDFFYGVDGSLFAQFTVRQFEATSPKEAIENWRSLQKLLKEMKVFSREELFDTIPGSKRITIKVLDPK